jgi:mRNA interferase RelE/StbE
MGWMTNLPYEIKLSPAAQRQIAALSSKSQKDIIRLVETLAINPRPPGAKKIEGMVGLYSEEMNHLRLIYKVEEQEVLVLLVK